MDLSGSGFILAILVYLLFSLFCKERTPKPPIRVLKNFVWETPKGFTRGEYEAIVENVQDILNPQNLPRETLRALGNASPDASTKINNLVNVEMRKRGWNNLNLNIDLTLLNTPFSQ